MDSNRFYVYCHIRKTDGKCFYIGKGCNGRYKNKYRRNQYWNKIVNKHGFESIILINNISEKKAFELEASFCKQIGYKNLCNVHVPNGWGGHSITEETRKKMQKPKPKSTSFRKKQSETWKNKSKEEMVDRSKKLSKAWENKDKQDLINRIKQANSKSVFCKELDKKWKSVATAAYFLKINPRSITNNIHGRSKSVRYGKVKLTFTYLLKNNTK